jgi:hypothetical protein
VAHLYNAYAYKLLLTKPKLRSGGRVLFHSPTSVDKVLATNAGTFFTRKSIQGVLRGGKDIAVVQFCEALHWRLLVLWGTERVAQYANPYGTALPRRHALARRVEGFHGWSTRSILLALQPEEDDYISAASGTIFFWHACSSTYGLQTSLAARGLKPSWPRGPTFVPSRPWARARARSAAAQSARTSRTRRRCARRFAQCYGRRRFRMRCRMA